MKQEMTVRGRANEGMRQVRDRQSTCVQGKIASIHHDPRSGDGRKEQWNGDLDHIRCLDS